MGLSLFLPAFFKEAYICLFIFGCTGSSLLCEDLSSCGERGLLFVVVSGLPITVAFLLVVHGLSCSVACGISPDQGSNWCSLH